MINLFNLLNILSSSATTCSKYFYSTKKSKKLTKLIQQVEAPIVDDPLQGADTREIVVKKKKKILPKPFVMANLLAEEINNFKFDLSTGY